MPKVERPYAGTSTLSLAAADARDKHDARGVKFQHRHFATVADILRRRLTRSRATIVHGGAALWTALDVVEIFADELGATNPKFSRDRFMRACGFEP